MNSDLTLSSTFGLTLLLFIGLVFFIRASTKDRTERAYYRAQMSDVDLLEALRTYFDNRAYQVTAIDQASGCITLEGTVRASVFLAVFLGALAGVGLWCLALVTTIELPQWGSWPYLLLGLAPCASWFYWQGANRTESVSFQLQEEDETADTQAKLQVTAHRDELIMLESQLPLKRIKAE